MDFLYKDPLFILDTTGFAIFLLSFMIFFTFLKKKIEKASNFTFFYFILASIFLFSNFLYFEKLRYENTFSWTRLKGGDLQIFSFIFLLLLSISLIFLSLFLISEKKNIAVKRLNISITSIILFTLGIKKLFLSKTLNGALILLSILLFATLFFTPSKKLKKLNKFFVIISLFLSIYFFALFQQVIKISNNPLSLSKKEKITPSDCGCLVCHSKKFFKEFKIKDRGKFRLFMLSNHAEEIKNLKIPPQVVDKLAENIIKENKGDRVFDIFFKKGCFNCHTPKNDKNKISTGGGFLDFKKYPRKKLEDFLLKKDLTSFPKGSNCMKGYNLSKEEVNLLLNYIYTSK